MSFFSGKNILIISPEPWGKSMLSKHHYAVALVEAGNKVWFLQTIGADIELAKKYIRPGIILLEDTFTIRGARFIPPHIRKWLYRIIVQDMQKRAGVNFDIVWSFDNSRFFDLDCFKRAYRIHHMMDFHTDYQNKVASSTADLCLGVTDGIVNKMKQYNQKSYFIQHAYNPVRESEKLLPEVQQRLKALWTGNLIMPFVNWPWVHALIEANRDTHFFLAGSYDKGNMNPNVNQEMRAEVIRIGANSNVTLLGECTTEEIQGFMKQVDLLFFAYRSNEFPEILANSHKLMAYFASGKPVVSHAILQYKDTNDLLYMASTLEEYLDVFAKVKQNLDSFTRRELKYMRMGYANENTYAKQLDRIDQIISAHLI